MFKSTFIVKASVIILALLLAGCPGVTRLYVHNKSGSDLVHHAEWEGADSKRIRPGRTRWVPVFGREVNDSEYAYCVVFEHRKQRRAFLISGKALEAAQSTGYGSRIDAFFEYDRMFVKAGDGAWVQIPESNACDYR